MKAKIYSEVYGVLTFLGNWYIEKLPKDIWNHIQNSVETNSITKIESFKDIQKLSIKSRALLSNFHLKYWCQSAEEYNKLKHILIENSIKQEQEKQKKFPPNFFKDGKKE